MPDLDLIKQGEQGVRDRRGRFARADRAIPPASRAAAATVNRAGLCSPATRRRLAEAVQPRGEALLQIRCRCSDERSSMQFVIVVSGDPGAPSGSVSSNCAARHFRERPGVKGSTSASFWRRRYPTIEGVGRRLSSFRGCLRRLATGYVPALI